MIIKHRKESEELTIFNVLNRRMTLSNKDRQYYFGIKKGYEGEVMFDEFTEKLISDFYILNDLLFKVNNTLFQIDSLIIISGKIYFFEVKNFEGDYLYNADLDSLYKLPNKEYSNPLHQIKRSESLLRQLLQNNGYNLSIEANIVFINPEFTLYQAPLNKHFILPTQVKSFIQKLNAVQISNNDESSHLASKLVSLHIKKSPYTHLPEYKFEQLKKGVNCSFCYSFSISVRGQVCTCGSCGYEESVETAVVRAIKELMLLFPDLKVTNSVVMEWCRIVNCRKRISRILTRNFKAVGNSRWTFYK
ncbi:nuclease-related domain-containing protein [Cytobacillus praedii]|uniref:NERD domain-containing protein n=1 Tax=Cytobacillus praedii TaxID=1742358 RepID=A0A4R1B1Z7_9BACI|nr:nuclease-related domain-containing protein [Cytobacillus praedii]TCJ04114.1 NERD domain-containing protein [Cytobacillus praedii]